MRDAFLAVLYNGPLVRADAILLLAGEDSMARIATAMELMRRQAADRIIISGGRHEPPQHLDAQSVRMELIAQGLAEDRILVEDKSRNTYEQALQVLDLPQVAAMKSLMLVASAYHLPRAFLTFVAMLKVRGVADTLRIVPVPAFAAWDVGPLRDGPTRLQLFLLELDKIGEYQQKGNVAAYEDGLDYLIGWERHDLA